MIVIHKLYLALAALAAAAILVIGGCSNSTESQTGTLSLRLTDAPAAFQQVNIVVTRVDVHASGSDSEGWFTINDVPATYDLLTLRNGANAVLGTEVLPVGHYTQVRLIIGPGSNVVLNDTAYPLEIPSGMQTGIKLNHGFDILPDQLYELMLDFDAERSINLTGSGTYMLSPVIRVNAVTASGSISGIVAPVTAHASVAAIVSPDTIRTQADPLTGAFTLMPLAAGVYSVLISPSDTLLADTTIALVAVVPQQDTNLGTVTLHAK